MPLLCVSTARSSNTVSRRSSPKQDRQERSLCTVFRIPMSRNRSSSAIRSGAERTNPRTERRTPWSKPSAPLPRVVLGDRRNRHRGLRGIPGDAATRGRCEYRIRIHTDTGREPGTARHRRNSRSCTGGRCSIGTVTPPRRQCMREHHRIAAPSPNSHSRPFRLARGRQLRRIPWRSARYAPKSGVRNPSRRPVVPSGTAGCGGVGEKRSGVRSRGRFRGGERRRWRGSRSR